MNSDLSLLINFKTMTVLAKANTCVIDYNGKTIYHVDYSNKRSMYDLIDAIEQAKMFCEIHIKENDKKDILVLMDLSNSFVFGKAIDMLNQSTKELKYYTKKRAVVGLDRSKMLFLNLTNSIFGNKVKAFNSVSKAKEWLAE